MDADHAPQRFPDVFQPRLVLRPSRLAAVALLLPVVLALLLAIAAGLTWRLPLALLLFAWLVPWWRRERARGLRALALAADGNWQLHGADGRVATCAPAGHAILGVVLVQLHFRDPRHARLWPARRVLIWRDAVEADAFRRLCVYLRLGGQGIPARLPFV